ncbi:MAG: hypothetical protein ISS82_04065 [Nanoarchaeota archaeon]|nr:hypothetical protein [Nanoarchaeota archaeon]
MELNKTGIKILDIIVKGANNREKISKALDLSKTWVSDNLSKLEKLKFIKKNRKRTVYVELSETSFAQEFKNMLENNTNIKFEDFLYGLNFRILSYCLFDWKNSKNIANGLNLNKKTIWNRLIVLTSRGLLTKKRYYYLTNQRAWPILYRFLEKYRMFYLGKGEVLWRFEDELIFRVNREEDVKGSLTGFSQYPRLRIGIMGYKYCCYLPRKRLNKEEIFIHSILEIHDSRELMLALVFYLKYKLNKKKLEDLAMKYDCSKKLEDLRRILKQEKTEIFSFIKEKELKEFFGRYKAKWKRN